MCTLVDTIEKLDSLRTSKKCFYGITIEWVHVGVCQYSSS